MNIEEENQIRILKEWYKSLDGDYHEEDRDRGCGICLEAIELGIIEDTAPDQEGDR